MLRMDSVLAAATIDWAFDPSMEPRTKIGLRISVMR